MQRAQEIKITTQTHVEEIVVDVQPGLLPEDVEVRAEGHRVFLKSTILFKFTCTSNKSYYLQPPEQTVQAVP